MELSLFFFFLTVPVLGCNDVGEGGVAVTAGDDDRDHGAGEFMFDVGSERECACGNVRTLLEVEDEGVIGMGDTNSGLLAVELVCWDGVAEEEGIGDAEVETERGIPHKPHALRAAGESPGGLRNPQISHSQTSNALTSETESTSDEPTMELELVRAGVLVLAVAVTFLLLGPGSSVGLRDPSSNAFRCRVTFGELFQNPA